MNALTRRQFLKHTSIISGTVALSFPYVGRVLGANDTIGVACIGVGGKGDEDSRCAGQCGGNIVAICDVDQTRLDSKGKSFPNAKKYGDYRKMFDEIGKDIDAVTISTPDHHHGNAAVRAMKMGKHVHCQKPLVQTVNEARILRKLAAEKKLATQMGNQGSAGSGLRRAVEVVQGGVIGDPTEIHVWSNRPIWPQGLERPAGEDPVPATLNWDCWLGPAPLRPYKGNRTYHDFNWRGWYDFGTGALGDMACHTVNMPFRACKLGFPNVVECELASRMYPETFPKTTRIRYEFPAREGLPPLKFWWYDGAPVARNSQDPSAPLRPGADIVKEIVTTRGTLPNSGALIIGNKGKLFSPDDYGSQFFLCMRGEQEFKTGSNHPACQDIPQTLPRLDDRNTVLSQVQEWFEMMKTGKPAYSNFDIAAYLTEIILLGAVALRVGEGVRVEWDGPNMKSTNVPAAEQFVSRKDRPGWEVSA